MRGGTFVTGALAVLALAGCHKDKPAPSIEGLTASLEHTADKALDGSSIAGEQVILTATEAGIDAIAADVMKAAAGAGGVGLHSTTPAGESSVLATVPENNAEAFKAAVQHQPFTMQKPSSQTRLIEVVIQKPPAASPTP